MNNKNSSVPALDVDYPFEQYKNEFFVRIGQGMYQAPIRQRLIGGIARAREMGPALGGNMAGWCGSFAFFGNGLKYYRQKDDQWNDTLGGGVTAFIILFRSAGFKGAMYQALQMGFFFYLIESYTFNAKVKQRQQLLDNPPKYQITRNGDEYQIMMNQAEYEKLVMELEKQNISFNKHSGGNHISVDFKK
eukprot:403335126